MNISECARIMGKKGGSRTSPAKIKASRRNGRLGGRPRKKTAIIVKP